MNTISSLFKRICATVLLCVCMTPALAHEYWLQAEDRQWVAGEQLRADIRNGENFVGSTLPFDPDALARAGLISDNSRLALSGRLGDYPAFQMPLQETGLHLLLLETTQRELRYDAYSDFETFLNYHGLQGIAERHRSRGLPREDIVEHYYRYCKSFVDVQPRQSGKVDTLGTARSERSASALAPQEQRLELIALDNPMHGNTLQLQLHFEGAPLANRQVELFYRDSESAAVSRTVRDTDTNGLVTFDTAASGDYLFNSVNVVEPADPSAHWETLWASLSVVKRERSTQ